MQWYAQVYKWLNVVQSGLYPPLCPLCGQRGSAEHGLCKGCLNTLPRNRACCEQCAAPLPHAQARCGRCSRRPPPFSRSVIPFRYEAPFDFLIQQLKFHQRLDLAPTLGMLLADAVKAQPDPKPALLLPVPMHRLRLRERGYNQALELARVLSAELAIPVDWKRCRRIRHTLPQTRLQGRERRRNMRGAFGISTSVPRHVAIVDDVVTTGATVSELARLLRRAGAERVDVWACARAERGVP